VLDRFRFLKQERESTRVDSRLEAKYRADLAQKNHPARGPLAATSRSDPPELSDHTMP
jgi:hypothetical protein